MAYIDYVTKVLNIQPEAAPTRVRLSQYENGRTLYFTLVGNENPIPNNVTVTISGTKPDGTVYSGTGSISNGDTVLIQETVQMTAAAGPWDAKVKLTSGGNTVATGRIRFLIDADTVAPGSVPSDSTLEGLVEQAQQYAETARQEAYGSPLTASTVSGMTDHTRVYVYTGSETGYTFGHWYYWNGTAWTDGGVYNSTAVQTDKNLVLSDVAADAKAVGDAIAAVTIPTDKTLTISDAPADAKVVGDELAGVKSDLSDIRTASGINLINPDALIPNTFLNSTTGLPETSNFYWATDYIPVDGTYTIKPFEYSGSARIRLYRYNSNKEFINRTVAPPESYPNGYTFSLTGYVRINIDNGTLDSYENPKKYLLIAGSSSAGVADIFIPYYTAYDRTARANLTASLKNIKVDHKASYTFTDLNDINDNSIYYVSPSRITSNYPPNPEVAYIETTVFNAKNKLQIAYSAYGTKAYIRACVVGTWRDWTEITLGGNSGDPLTKKEYYETSTIALFSSVGCCGDSFTAGYLYNKPDSQWYDPNYAPTGAYSHISYGKVMGRLYGLDVTLYAKGGLTSTAWRTDSVGLPALRADDPKDLYIICLGLNDCTNNKVPLGVQADLDTEPAEPTWYGNMGAIIRSIQSHAPMSRIVLLKSPWVYRTVGGNVNSHYTYNSAAIEYIKTHLGIPYLETLGDPYFCGTEYIEGVEAHGLHPTAPLYAGMGKRIGELVGKCIIDNPEYFYNFYIAN